MSAADTDGTQARLLFIDGQIELEGRVALPGSTPQKIMWGLPNSEEAAQEEWIRLPDNIDDAGEIRIPAEAALTSGTGPRSPRGRQRMPGQHGTLSMGKFFE